MDALWQRCRWPGLALACALATLSATRAAHAEACCGGGSALEPWRLEHHQPGLVGVRARVAPALGEFDGDGAYHPLPKGVRELEAEALIFGAVRVAPRFQLGLQLPLVLHNRAADGIDAAGGGPGDVALGLRWDPLLAGESGGLPGVGLELAVVAPTGTAPEDATDDLAVDATGLGAWQLGLDAAVEHVFGASRQWLVSARGGFRWRSAYTVDGATATRPVEGHARLGAALVLPDALVLAASLDGSWAGSEEHLIGLGLNLAVPLGESWRCLASVTTTLPIDGLAANQPLGLGLAMTLVYAGW